MKIVAEIDCESRHCDNCSAMILKHGNNLCTVYNKVLRETGRGVLRCKQCMESEQEYKKLDSLRTCETCRRGPQNKCVQRKYCTRAWGKEGDLWES
jgi:hypothetical protein